jgi:hypothetical protein
MESIDMQFLTYININMDYNILLRLNLAINIFIFLEMLKGKKHVNMRFLRHIDGVGIGEAVD